VRFLKAITTEGRTEYFNVAQILTITQAGDSVKILMGAGLYYWVKPETLVFVDLEYIPAELMGV
jgi:hypothetical protein